MPSIAGEICTELMLVPEYLRDEMYYLRTSSNENAAMYAFKDDSIVWAADSSDNSPFYTVALSELPGYAARIIGMKLSMANIESVIFDVGVMDKNYVKLGEVSDIYQVICWCYTFDLALILYDKGSDAIKYTVRCVFILYLK